jgi:hypothetical protein
MSKRENLIKKIEDLKQEFENKSISKEEYNTLIEDAFKESGIGMFSAESPLNQTRIPMEPNKANLFSEYNLRKKQAPPRDPEFNFSFMGMFYGAWAFVFNTIAVILTGVILYQGAKILYAVANK